MWICIAPCRDHTSKVLGYGTHSQGISQFYLHTSANGMNHTCLWPWRDGRLRPLMLHPHQLEGISCGLHI